MAKNRFFYLLFFLACLIFSAAYQSRISAILLVVAIAYPIIAAIFTAISLFTLRVGFAEKRSVHEKNEVFELALYLHNNFVFPYAPAELDCLIPDTDTGLFLSKQIFVCVAPLKKIRVFVPCMHRYRGSFASRITKIAVYDPLKIIRFTRKTDSIMQLVFLPRKIPVERLGEVFAGERGPVPEQQLTGEKDDFSHVREYAMGDVFQMIHWKLTAKYDDLMVKQYDSNKDRRSVVLCNFSHGTATPSAVLRQSDAVVETAIAVAMSITRSGVKTIVDTGTLEAGACEISDQSCFDRFYDMMSVMPIKLNTVDFSELISKYISTEAAAMFIITSVLNESIISHAEMAGEQLNGAVVLIYVNCSGKSIAMAKNDHHFVFAEICGDTQNSLPAVTEQILLDYVQLQK